MKAFSLTATGVAAGLRVHRGPQPYIAMGEPPEDGSSLHITVAPEEIGDLNILYRCDVIIRKNKKRMFVPERTPDNDALVVADIRGATNSATVWSPARPVPHPCPARLRAGAANQLCPECGMGYMTSRHPDAGFVMAYSQFPPGRVEVLNRSWVRHGTISKPPWAVVYLLRMKPDSMFRVYRGNVEDGLRERFVSWDGSDINIGSQEEIL